jgi:hypothetical protein
MRAVVVMVGTSGEPASSPRRCSHSGGSTMPPCESRGEAATGAHLVDPRPRSYPTGVAPSRRAPNRSTGAWAAVTPFQTPGLDLPRAGGTVRPISHSPVCGSASPSRSAMYVARRSGSTIRRRNHSAVHGTAVCIARLARCQDSYASSLSGVAIVGSTLLSLERPGAKERRQCPAVCDSTFGFAGGWHVHRERDLVSRNGVVDEYVAGVPKVASG